MEIKIQYTGRRIVNDKLAWSFLQDGEEIYFAKLKSLTVGEWYIAITGEDDKVSMKTRPEWTEGPAPSEEDLKKWEAEDLLARQEMRRRAFAAKMEKHTAIVECAARLKPLLRGLGFSQKRQIVDFIMAERDELWKRATKFVMPGEMDTGESIEHYIKTLEATTARQAKVIEKLKRYTQHRVDCICRAGVFQYSNDCDCGLKAIEREGEGT